MIIHKLNKNQKALLKNSFGNRQNQLNVDKKRLYKLSNVTIQNHLPLNLEDKKEELTDKIKELIDKTKEPVISIVNCISKSIPIVSIDDIRNNNNIIVNAKQPKLPNHSNNFDTEPELFTQNRDTKPKDLGNMGYKTNTTSIPMDIFLSDIVVSTNFIQTLKQKKIKTIKHMYCYKYYDTNGRICYPTGLGDFIRSCFFTLQFCKNYGFLCEIKIAHPICEFLLSETVTPSTFIDGYDYEHMTPFTTMFKDTNWVENKLDTRDVIVYSTLNKHTLNKYAHYLGTLPVYKNGTILSYNIMFPYEPISKEDILFLRNLFEPSTIMVMYVCETLSNFGVFDMNSSLTHQYGVLHIRSGDDFLIHGKTSFTIDYFNVLIKDFIHIIQNEGSLGNKIKKWILLADNNEVKRIVMSLLGEFSQYVVCSYENISHIGEGVYSQKGELKQTMIEFYVMSMAKEIYSFSSYAHGSGFSYWCSVLYNIPYQCKYIRNI